MLRLRFAPGELRRVLCLGAHADDIEIGCGGTLLRLIAEHPGLEVCWVVFSALGERAEEAVRSAEVFLSGVQSKHVSIHQFRDGFFPYLGPEVKERVLALEREFVPDLVFTHWRGDLHQDHRVVSELTRNSFRKQPILEYEIPKFDGDMSSPNLLAPLDRDICKEKVSHLLSAFPSQHGKDWFTEETFWSWLRVRGVECRAPSGYAEGFYCYKLWF